MTIGPELALDAGWRVRSITSSRGLAGANGMRFGPDGQLYVASAFGSVVARVDVDGGGWTTACGAADGIVSPDDLAFSGEVMYAAECMNARVSAWHGGHARVIADDLSGANGIDAFEGRLFVGQFLPEGKLWEIFPAGGSPRRLGRRPRGAERALRFARWSCLLRPGLHRRGHASTDGRRGGRESRGRIVGSEFGSPWLRRHYLRRAGRER